MAPVTTSTTASDHLGTPRLDAAFRVAADWLALNRDAINAINVYPVPDGDTGTNLLLTLRAALEAAEPAASGSITEFATTLARGALLGARGNSGVIFSQMLRGLAESFTSEPEDADADAATRPAGVALARALARASTAAYEAVPSPIEGTMLTVLREAADAAIQHVTSHDTASPASVLQIAQEAAHRSVERTPELLPALREAGVVDAGGLGIAVIIEGLLHGYEGSTLPPPRTAPLGAVTLDSLAHEGHGYCTEFVVRGVGLDQPALRLALGTAGGESLLVVGDSEMLRVHVHIADPGVALAVGSRAGIVEAVKVDNMQAQHERWTAAHQERALTAPDVGLVAVASGPGLAQAFRALGAVVVAGGPGASPSAGELLAAARAAGRERVFLLPNESNVLLTARQAALEAAGLIEVIPTRSMLAGLAAAVAFNPGANPASLGVKLAEAASAVRSIEVTRAVRDAASGGVRVRGGDAIALVDGTLRAAAADLEAALMAGVAAAIEDGGAPELVTLSLGVDAPPDAAQRLTPLLRAACPGAEIEVIAGGQPYYPYLLALE